MNDEHPVTNFWSDYWRFLLPFRPKLWNCFGWIIAMQILAIIEPTMVMYLVDRIIRLGAGARQHIWWFAGLSLLTLLGIGVIKVIKDRGVHILGAILVRDVQQTCSDKLLRLTMDYHHRTNSGELMSKITKGVGKVNDITMFLLSEIGPLVAQTVISTIILLRLRASTTLSLIPVIAIFIWLTHDLKRRTLPGRRKRHHHANERDRRIGQSVANILTVQANNREAHESEIIRRHNSTWFDILIEDIKRSGYTELLRNGAVSFGRIAIIIQCAFAVFTTKLTIGEMVLIVTLAEKMFTNCYRIGGIYDRVMDAQEPVQSILKLIAEVEVDPDPECPEILPVHGTRHIELRDVSFAYPKNSLAQQNIWALNDVSLTVQPGDTLGIVGQSGSGKSTLAMILLGYYRPAMGNVFIDGIDITRLSRKSLREEISFISQDPELFDDTVRNNILYGRLDATEEEVIAAAKKAQAHEFIMEIGGYDTMLGNRGLKLSGGQRQRLTVARALIRRSSILVGDEPTSAVDPETIRDFQHALGQAQGTRTAVMITHQLSTIQKAAGIALIERGKLVAVGSHHKLLQRCAQYRNLVQIQQRMDDELQVQTQIPALA